MDMKSDVDKNNQSQSNQKMGQMNEDFIMKSPQ